MTLMNVADKLKKAREYLGKNQEEMADLCDIAHRTYQRYEQEKGLPSGKVIVKLAESGFNTHWFFTDDSSVPMLVADLEETVTGKKALADLASAVGLGQPLPHEDDFGYVPMAETRLSAGDGAFVLSERTGDLFAFRKRWLRRMASSPANLLLMVVNGDSMSATIKDGDCVLLDTGRKHIYDGNIYALRLDDTIVIKRLSLRPENKVLIISDNKDEYPPYESLAKDIQVLGQIIWIARNLVSGK